MPVVTTALTYNQLDALSKATVGMPLYNFLMDGTGKNATSYSDNSWEISLAEILGGYRNFQSSDWQKKPLTDLIAYNFKKNGLGAFGQVIAGKVIANVLKRMGVFRNLNKVNKMVGVEKVARWS